MSYPFSASSIERVVECPASTALQAVYSCTEDGDRGTEIHSFAQRIIEGMPREIALALVPKEWRHTCEGFDVHGALAGMRSVRAEVSYAVNARTGSARELGSGLARNYVVDEGEVPGTNDVDAIGYTNIPVVSDWKTGREEVAPCKENLQITFQAYAKAEVTGATEVEGRIGYVRDNGRVQFDRHVFTRFELDSFADTLAQAERAAVEAQERRAKGLPLAVSPGDHCRYCPALAACPAHMALARQMIPNLESIGDRIEAMTPEQAGKAWTMLASIKVIAERVDDGLKALAKQSPIPLGNGKEVRAITFERPYFAKDKAVEMLTAKGATAEEIASLETHAVTTQVRVMKARR